MTTTVTIRANTAPETALILTDPTETEIAVAMDAVLRVDAQNLFAAALGVVDALVTGAAAALAYGDPDGAAGELRRARAVPAAVRRLLELTAAVRA